MLVWSLRLQRNKPSSRLRRLEMLFPICDASFTEVSGCPANISSYVKSKQDLRWQTPTMTWCITVDTKIYVKKVKTAHNIHLCVSADRKSSIFWSHTVYKYSILSNPDIRPERQKDVVISSEGKGSKVSASAYWGPQRWLTYLKQQKSFFIILSRGGRGLLACSNSKIYPWLYWWGL